MFPTHFLKEGCACCRSCKHHNHVYFCLHNAIQNLPYSWHRVFVDWYQAFVGYTNAPIGSLLRHILLTLLAISLITADHRHPVPAELLQQLHHGQGLPLVSGGGAHKRWVCQLVTEPITGGSIADLQWERATELQNNLNM